VKSRIAKFYPFEEALNFKEALSERSKKALRHEAPFSIQA
jgi:hypothetical protein